MRPSDWSKAVIERDQACADCGAKVLLKAIHVQPGFDVSNGVAVCVGCYQRRHRLAARPMRQLYLSSTRKPQRKTLNRRIAKLTAELGRLNELERENRNLKDTIRRWLTRATNSR